MRPRPFNARLFSRWIVGILAIGLVALGIWRSPASQPSRQFPAAEPQNQVSLSSGSTSHESSLEANGDRLLQDVEAIAFDRSDETGRARVRRYLTNQLELTGWNVEAQPYASTAASNTESNTESSASQGINLIATQPGDQRQPSDRLSQLIVGAHYDTVPGSPGADDNGSGVAALLELARIFGDRPISHRLKLVLFDQEEIGLRGSRAFVAEHLQSQQGDRPAVVGALILEMLGYTCDRPGCQTYPETLPIEPPSTIGNFLAVVGNVEHPNLVEAFEPDAEDGRFLIFPLQVPAFSPGSPDLMRSDHVPFWQNGYGAVMVSDTANFRNPHYHQPSDTADTLSRDFLRYSTTVVARAIARLLSDSHSIN